MFPNLSQVRNIRGAAAVAEVFKGRAQGAKPAMVDGALGAAVVLGGQFRIVLAITIQDDRISAINAIADPDEIKAFDVEVLGT